MKIDQVSSTIGNKIKREQVYQDLKRKKSQEKLERRLKRKREEEECEDPSKLAEKEKPKTLESLREKDETIVDLEDEEVLEDEAQDEFAEYFNGLPPKMVITTSKRPSSVVCEFAEEMADVFPNSEFRKRGVFDIKHIVKEATERGYTDIMIINEDRKKPNAMTLIHLPHGPTAVFKLRSVLPSNKLYRKTKSTSHSPELVLNNFNTRLGHSVGRFFASLLPQNPEFRGRQVVTLHNQRDFIFFRRHRYMFKSKEKVDIQEIGPRFTLKLKSLQKGTFDSKFGEYEWVHKPDLDTSKRRFFL